MATYLGIKNGSRRIVNDQNGTSVMETHLVKDAADQFEAIGASGLPRINDRHPDDPSLFCQLVEGREPQDDSYAFYHFDLTYSPPRGTGVFPLTVQEVTWNYTTQTQHVDVDIDGVPIGSRYFVGSDGDTLVRRALIDEEATLGFDVLVGALAVDVRLPVPNPYKPAEIYPIIARTNLNSFTIDGYTIPPRTAILDGCTARRVNSFGGHEIHYRIIIGQYELPAGLQARFARDMTPYVGTFVPIGYGYSFLFTPRDRDGNLAETQEAIAWRRPWRTLIHQSCRAVSFAPLGIV